MNLYILNTNEEVVEILSGKADNSACHFFNAIMTKEINKGATLTFEVDMAELGGSENIKEENMVVVPDGDSFKLFIIREVVDVHGTDFIKEVYCEDASIELADEVCLEAIEGKHEILSALNILLKGTRWKAGEVDDVYIRNLDGEYKGNSVLAGITTLVGEYDVEVDYSVSFAGNKITGRYVHIKEAFGRTLGKRFEYKKDIVSLKRTVNTGDIKTAIIPFGKVDEETGEAVTIEGVSWSQPTKPLNKPIGQTFLEDEEATQLWGYKGNDGRRRARWIVINFEECESAEELLSLAYLQLRRFTSPTVTYEVEAQDLYLLTGDKDYSFETVALGDLVNIIDHDFVPALTLQSRIVKIEQNLNFPAESKITMGTIVKSIVDKDLQTQLNELNYKVSAVANNVDLSSVNNRLDNLETNISSGKWEAISEINNLLFGEAVGYHYIEEGNGVWVYDRPKDQNPTKAVAIKGGTIGLASYDKQLQKWIVGTFIDGNSVNASMINTGTLSAERIETDSLTTKHFSLDVRNKLAEIDGKATTGYVDTKVEAVAGEIELSVSSKYSTKSETSSAVSTAKTEAITQAGKDADSKVASAKSELNTEIGKKANSTDVYKKTETYTKTETDSKITASKDAVTLAVSQTYETKTNVDSKINTAVNNVQIGGTNIAKGTNKGIAGWNWALSSGGRTVTEVVENDIKCCKIVRDNVAVTSWSYIQYSNINRNKYLPNKKYTVSFEVKASVSTDFTVGIKCGNATNPLTNDVWAGNTVANTWTKLSATVTTKSTLPTDTSQVLYLSGMNSGVGVSYIFRNLKIEEGTKPSAWTPAPEDVQASIDTKANSSDVYKKTETYTKSETDSAIKVAKESIELGVSTNYETKTNVETKISTAVNNVQIGGRNLQKNTEFKTNLTSWVVGTGYTRDTSKLFEKTNTVKFTRTGLTADSVSYLYSGTKAIPIEVGQTVTASANFYTDSTSGIDGGKAFIGIWFYNSSGSYIANSRTTIPFVNGKWVKTSHTATAPANTVYTAIVIGTNRNGTYYIAKPMFEKGNKAGDWSPSPDDVQSAIDTKANSSDVYTKTETDSKITVASNSITSSVSSTYLTKTDATNTYATKSTLTQTENSIVAKFTASGGYNLIRNSSGYNGTSTWTASGLASVGTFTTTASTPTGRGIYIDNGTKTTESYMYSSRFRLAPNTTYTLTGWFNNYTACPSFDVFVLSSTSLDETSTDVSSYTNVHHLANGDTNGVWKEFTWTFTTPASTKSGIVRIDNNGYDSAYTTANRVYFSSLMLVEGAVGLPWSPHPNEVYDGNTTIDKNGVTVKNGGLTIKNNAGTTVLSGDTSGNLKLAGSITSGATITGGVLKSTNGDMYFDMNNGYMLLYNSGTKVGQTQKNNITGTSYYGISNGCEYGSYTTLSCKESSSASSYTMYVTCVGQSISTFTKGVNIGYNSYWNKWNCYNMGYIYNPSGLIWNSTTYTGDTTKTDDFRIYPVTSGTTSSLYIRGGYHADDKVKITHNSSAGHKSVADFTYNTDGTGIHFWRTVDLHKWGIKNAGTVTASLMVADDVEVNAPFEMYTRSGEEVKYKIPKTLTPTTEYVGSAEVVNGECIVELPMGLLLGDKGYMVILTAIGKKEIWLDSKDYESFTVKGDDCQFDYVIKAHTPNLSLYTRGSEFGEDVDEPEDAVGEPIHGNEISFYEVHEEKEEEADASVPMLLI